MGFELFKSQALCIEQACHSVSIPSYWLLRRNGADGRYYIMIPGPGKYLGKNRYKARSYLLAFTETTGTSASRMMR